MDKDEIMKNAIRVQKALDDAHTIQLKAILEAANPGSTDLFQSKGISTRNWFIMLLITAFFAFSIGYTSGKNTERARESERETYRSMENLH